MTTPLKPLLVIPTAAQVSQMLDPDALRAERAREVGIVIMPPRAIRSVDLMAACHFWPPILARTAVRRTAVVLGVAAYVSAQPMLGGCEHRMTERGVTVAYFHEGHLESDQIRAWFEHRAPRRRVTTDALIKLSERYALRGDIGSAANARRLAEAAATGA